MRLSPKGLELCRTFQAQADSPLGFGALIPSPILDTPRSSQSFYSWNQDTTVSEKVSNKGISFCRLSSAFGRLISTSTVNSNPDPKNHQWGKRGYSVNAYYPKQLKNSVSCPCDFLSAFLLHIPHFVFIFDHKLTLLFANRVMSGHPSQFIGRSILYRIHPDYRKSMEKVTLEVFKTMRPIQVETRNIDGHETTGTIVPITKKIAFSIVSLAHRKILSKREREILNFIKDGFSSKQIADKLNIAVSSVSTHRKNIRKKI